MVQGKPEFRGDRKPSFKEAAEDAHAKAHGHSEKWLVVSKIEVIGPNAIRDYRVTLQVQD